MLRVATVLVLAEAVSPVSKVVTLLKELQDKAEAQKAADLKEHSKFSCWTFDALTRKLDLITDRTNIIAKTMKAHNQERQISASSASIIEKAEGLIAKAEKVIASSTETRNTDRSDYNGVTAETFEALGALAKALKALEGRGMKKGALDDVEAFDKNKEAFLQARELMQTSIRKIPASLDLDLSGLESLRFMLDSSKDMSLLQQEYNPRSTKVVGTLKGLYIDMSKAHVKLLNEEVTAQKAHEDLVEEQNKLIADYQATIEEKTQAKAKADEAIAKALSEIQLAIDERDAATAFFKKTNENGLFRQQNWETRDKERELEIQAIQGALDILDTAANRRAFAASDSDTDFLQLKAVTVQAKMAEHHAAFAGLQEQITAGMAAGHFSKVITQIGKVIDNIKKENEQDIKKRDTCIKELHEDKVQTAETNQKIYEENVEQESLKADIAEYTANIDQAKEDIQSAKDQMKELTQQRKEDNKAFKKSVSDDEKAIDLLQKALKSLTDYYSARALIQQEPAEFEISEDDAPKGVDTEAYKGNQGQANSVITLIKNIINTAQEEITEATQNEAAEKAAYLDAIGSLTNDLTNAKERKSLNTKAKTKANKEKKISENKEDGLVKKNNKLAKHMKKEAVDCDWIKAKYPERDAHRKDEIANLEEAKGVLQGMAHEGEAFVQEEPEHMQELDDTSSLDWQPDADEKEDFDEMERTETREEDDRRDSSEDDEPESFLARK